MANAPRNNHAKAGLLRGPLVRTAKVVRVFRRTGCPRQSGAFELLKPDEFESLMSGFSERGIWQRILLILQLSDVLAELFQASRFEKIRRQGNLRSVVLGSTRLLAVPLRFQVRNVSFCSRDE